MGEQIVLSMNNPKYSGGVNYWQLSILFSNLNPPQQIKLTINALNKF